MKTLILGLVLLLLIGCKTITVMTPFPKPPADLMVRPPELSLIHVRTIETAASAVAPSK